MSFNCSTQTIPACTHGNYSHLPEDIKTILTKHMGESELIGSGCSEQLRRYRCYGQTSPCYIHGAYPYRPCRWFCELLKNECSREISLFNLSIPLCDELTERERVGDLCRIDSWPVPWPNVTNQKKGNVALIGCKRVSFRTNSCSNNRLRHDNGMVRGGEMLHG